MLTSVLSIVAAATAVTNVHQDSPFLQSVSSIHTVRNMVTNQYLRERRLIDRSSRLRIYLWRNRIIKPDCAIVYIHGGPFNSGPPTSPDGMRGLLLGLGCDVIEPEYAGDSARQHLDMHDNDFVRGAPAAIQQINKTIDYASRRYPHVLGYGDSLGAFLLSAAVNRDKRILPIILHVPLTVSPREFFIDRRPRGILGAPVDGTVLNLDDETLSRQIKKISDQVVLSYFGNLIDSSLSREIGQYRSRIMLIYGGRDTTVAAAEVEAIKPLLTSARYHFIPEAGHEDPGDQPWVPALRQALDEFIHGHERN